MRWLASHAPVVALIVSVLTLVYAYGWQGKTLEEVEERSKSNQVAVSKVLSLDKQVDKISDQVQSIYDHLIGRNDDRDK